MSGVGCKHHRGLLCSLKIEASIHVLDFWKSFVSNLVPSSNLFSVFLALDRLICVVCYFSFCFFIWQLFMLQSVILTLPFYHNLLEHRQPQNFLVTSGYYENPPVLKPRLFPTLDRTSLLCRYTEMSVCRYPKLLFLTWRKP